MKPQTTTPQELWNADDLNEWTLWAASLAGKDVVAPETSPENASITAWDESADAAGHRVVSEPLENEETISEQLVDAGNDEADREQRLSAALNQPAIEQR